MTTPEHEPTPPLLSTPTIISSLAVKDIRILACKGANPVYRVGNYAPKPQDSAVIHHNGGMSLSPDEAYRELQSYCLAKDGCVEDHPWGESAWKVNGKAFAFGGEGSARLTLKSTPDKQAALTMHPQIAVAAYVGRFGWVTVEVVDRETLDLAKDLIDESYSLVNRRARKR